MEARSPTPIDSNPRKMSGKLCIGQTRMPVADFLIHLRRGGSIVSFCEDFGMEPKDLHGVLEFAIHDLGEDLRVVGRARAWAKVCAEQSGERELASP